MVWSRTADRESIQGEACHTSSSNVGMRHTHNVLVPQAVPFHYYSYTTMDEKGRIMWAVNGDQAGGRRKAVG